MQSGVEVARRATSSIQQVAGMVASKFGICIEAGLACALVVMCAACGPQVQAEREWTPADHGQPPQVQAADDGRAAPPQDEDGAPNPDRALAALWNISCAGCHGRTGRGDGAKRPPGAVVPDFTRPEFHKSRTDAQLVAAVHEGRGLMPSFSDSLSEPTIRSLVGYIRAMLPTSASAAGRRPSSVVAE